MFGTLPSVRSVVLYSIYQCYIVFLISQSATGNLQLPPLIFGGASFCNSYNNDSYLERSDKHHPSLSSSTAPQMLISSCLLVSFPYGLSEPLSGACSVKFPNARFLLYYCSSHLHSPIKNLVTALLPSTHLLTMAHRRSFWVLLSRVWSPSSLAHHTNL